MYLVPTYIYLEHRTLFLKEVMRKGVFLDSSILPFHKYTTLQNNLITIVSVSNIIFYA